MSNKIFIDGQEGTTGLRIRKRLQGRNDLELLFIEETYRKDPEARLEMMTQADISFLCLPDAASREIIERAGNNHRILDTSTAFRTDPVWTYGFPELTPGQTEKIHISGRVAVPGCHATGFIALIKPLVALNIVDQDYPFVCHSLTGYSGGGKSMIAKYESENRDEEYGSPRQYGLDQNHKHLPEMKFITEINEAPAFHPIVDDYYNGMLVTVTLHNRLMSKKMNRAELRTELWEYYKNRPVIKVREAGEKPEDGCIAANVLAETDGLEIFILGNDDHISLMARYDNLGKGASGAAIQCMNIMLGLPETDGLVI